MPRPKVHPSNRQRAEEACDLCKASKKRCSATFPYSHCIRRGCADSCTVSKRSSKLPNSRCLVESSRFPQANNAVEFHPPPFEDADMVLSGQAVSIGTPVPSPTSHDAESMARKYSPAAPIESPEAPQCINSRMLHKEQGESVYVGGAASLSFLQLLRDKVTQYIGPSRFSQNTKSDGMLEDASPRPNIPSLSENSLDLDQKIEFSRVYHMVVGLTFLVPSTKLPFSKTALAKLNMFQTNGIIDVVSTSETEKLLEDAIAPVNSISGLKLALADLIVAIGAQCSNNESSTIQAEGFFFARGQRLAFNGMLEDTSLDLVRVFLLMSYYMLGATSGRNAAFLYLGVATQAAIALGLHSKDSYAFIAPNQYQKRLRTWMSVCVLDLLIGSILGRPSATSKLRSELGNDFFNIIQQSEPMETWLLTSYRLTDIVDEVANKVYSEKVVSTDAAGHLLRRLKQWTEELPDALRMPSLVTFVHTQKPTLGSLNVACLYYFTVTLVTRPFLISTLRTRLANIRQTLSGASPTSFHGDNRVHDDLASPCVDSAVYLVQTCLDVYKADMLLGNMCMMKAFIFSASLILGFAMFAQTEIDFEIEAAFAGAREMLQMFSLQ